MIECNECSQRLLDYLYDLLDAAELDDVCAHLEICAACRLELDIAKCEQRLIASAARVYESVPQFSAPDLHIVPKPAPTCEAAVDTVVQTRATLPDGAKEVARQPLRRRVLPWLAAAAGLVLAVTATVWWYQNGLKQRRAELVSLNESIQDIDTRYAALVTKDKQRKEALPNEALARRLHVHVYGSAIYQRGADNPIRIRARNLADVSTPIQLNVQLIDTKNRPLFTKQMIHKQKETLVALPGNLKVAAGEQIRLQVEASNVRSKTEKLTQTLVAAPPTYITQIVTNKPVYQDGELLFFRTLTLDRLTLQPAGKKFAFRYALVDDKGRPVKELFGESKHNGVGGGEFALTSDLRDGNYSLIVEEAPVAKDAKRVILAQAARFTLRRQHPGNLALDRSKYFAGDVVRGSFRANQFGRPGGFGGKQSQGKLGSGAAAKTKRKHVVSSRLLTVKKGADGRARIAVPLPKKMPPGAAELQIPIQFGSQKKLLTQTFKVVRPWNVEFFPEGGRLVANVANRVYLRVTAPGQKSVRTKGELVDARNQIVQTVDLKATGRAGLLTYSGELRFKPQAKQTYRLRVVARGKAKTTQELPAVDKKGLALTVANPVAVADTPIECRIHASTKVCDVLVVAACRGQAVDLQLARARPQGVTLRLHPGSNISGVLRLTAYEVSPQHLTPLAERLVFRSPKKSLVLSAQTNPAKNDNYWAGAKVDLELRARDKKGRFTTAWVAANVVNTEVFQRSTSCVNSPQDFFFMTGARRPADLEDACIVAAATKENRKKLDRFLAVAGWRRFVKSSTRTLTTRKTATAVKAETQPQFFSRDNNLHKIEKDYKKEVRQELFAYQLEFEHQRGKLQSEKSAKADQVKLAAAGLLEFEQLPQRTFGIAMGVSLVAFMALALVLILAGIWRIVVSAKAATPLFAAAFAALLLCVAVYAGAGSLRSLFDDPEPLANGQMVLARGELPPVVERRKEVTPNLIALRTNPLSDSVFSAKQAPARKNDVEKYTSKFGKKQLADAKVDPLYVMVADDLAKRMKITGSKNRRMRRGDSSRYRQMKTLQEQVDKLVKRSRASTSNKAAAPGTAPKNKNKDGGKSKLSGKMKQDKKKSNHLAVGRGSSKSGGSKGATTAIGGQPPFGLKGFWIPGMPFPPVKTGKEKAGASGGDRFGGATGMAFDIRRVNPVYARQYSNRNVADNDDAPDTLLWAPDVTLKNGVGNVRFNLPLQRGTYRIILYGHTQDGRLGFYESAFTVKKR